MLRRPDVDEVMEYGRALGFDLDPDEARMIQARMMDTIADARGLRRDARWRSGARRCASPIATRARRPSAVEDPQEASSRAAGCPALHHEVPREAGRLALHGKTVGAQGPHRARRRADDLQLAHDGRLHPGLRRHRGHAPARRRGHHHRQAQDGGVLVGRPRALRAWATTAARSTRTTASTSPAARRRARARRWRAGRCDIALGGDQGGSIRLPAAWCGIVGLMPTHGLVPHSGVFGLEPTIDYVGPMARTVEDMAVSLQCLAGRDGLDPRQADVPATPAALHRRARARREGAAHRRARTRASACRAATARWTRRSWRRCTRSSARARGWSACRCRSTPRRCPRCCRSTSKAASGCTTPTSAAPSPRPTTRPR